MLCFEITVNGKALPKMGHEQLRMMSVSLNYIPELANIELTSFGGTEKMNRPKDIVSWFTPVNTLGVGDVVAIRIIESKDAATPIEPRPVEDEPRATLYCAFCGREKSEVGRMVVGVVCICEACVTECQNVLTKG